MLIPTTIHAIDESSLLPIEGVVVTLWNSDYTFSYEGGLTDATGDAVLGLEPAAYRVFLQKADYTFYPQPKSIGVSESPETFDIVGVATVEPVIPEGLVWLYGVVKDLTLTPVPNATVYIALTVSPQLKDGAVLDRSIMSVTTDAEGKWGTLVPGGTHVTVTILSGKYMRTGVLPFTGRLDASELGVFG